MDTKERIVEILEFKHFCRFWRFDKAGKNSLEKHLVTSVTVVVAFEVVKGNTLE